MPRNVLNIPAKTSPLSSSALSKVFRAYIAEHFTDTHPDAFNDDLRHIARLHDHIIRMDAHVSNIESAQKYFAQLTFIITKFPPEIDLAFPWTIAFPPTLSLFSVGLVPDDSPPTSPGLTTEAAKSYAKTTGSSSIIAHPNLHYERAAVLFSLASLYSSLGAQESRSEGESIRRAIAYFQSSAGALQFLLTEFVPLLKPLFIGSNARFADPDLQPAMLACLRDAMLAQAQECFWQKAVVDKLKDVTIAKLASRVSELYAQALDYAETGGSIEPLETGAPRGCELPRDWINHMTIKRWHFAAAAHFRKSNDDLSGNRYGDELGRLKVAEGYVKKASETSRTGVSEALQSDLRSLQNAIQNNLTRAMKDNDLIYLEAITPASKLCAIPAAAMVEAKIPIEIAKPIQFLRDSPAPAFGKPLFQELVPYGVHIAISVFDGRKETLVREEIELKRQELDSLATSTLQSLDLPGSLQALEQPIGLPPALIRKSDEIKSEGGMERLHALSGDVFRVSQIGDNIWNEIVNLIRQAPSPDSINHPVTVHMAERHGQQVHAFDSQIEEYRQTLHQAHSSDQIVQQKLQEWKKVIDVLAKGEETLKQFVPGKKSPKSMMTGEQSATVRALREQMEELDDLIDARAAICEEAKSKAKRQDIRNEVMREAGSIASGQNAPLVIEPAHFEPLFERELAVYDSYRSDLQSNEEAQQKCLDLIAQKNEAFVHERKMDDKTRERQEALQTLDLGYAKYREISANLIEGLKFYNAMVKMLHELRENVAGWVHQRQDEMSDLTARIQQASLAAAAVHTPESKRMTRSRAAKASSTPSSVQSQTGGALPPPPPQPPNWGAWQGGDIRFAD